MYTVQNILLHQVILFWLHIQKIISECFIFEIMCATCLGIFYYGFSV